MEVKIKTGKDLVTVNCKCGECSLISSKQMMEFREQAEKFRDEPLPDVIVVSCNK